jgi:hypothetical protein
MKIDIEKTMQSLKPKTPMFESLVGLSYRDGRVCAAYVSVDDHGHGGGKISYRSVAQEDLVQ